MLTCAFRNCAQDVTPRRGGGVPRLYCSDTCRANERSTRHRERRRAEALDLLGSKCERCGYSKCKAALNFHHNEGVKNFPLTMAEMGRPWSQIEAEVRLCILLCSNCHMEEHYN